MSMTKQMVDELNRRDLSPVEREHGEDLYDDGPWPTEDELDHDGYYDGWESQNLEPR